MGTYVSILSSIEAYECLPPEIVEAYCAKENVGIVSLVVVANPGPDESPHGLPGWVSSES